MKRERLPIYREQGRTFHADNCSPLAKAAAAGKIHLAALGRGAYPGTRIAKNALNGLRSIGVWDASTEQDWGLDWHRNEGIEVTFLESGRLSFSLDSRRHLLRPTEMTITRPWQPHRLGSPNIEAGRLLWFIFDVGVRQPHQSWFWPDWLLLTPKEMEELTKYLRQNEKPVWKTTRQLAEAFSRLDHALSEDPECLSTSRIGLYLNEALLLMRDMFRSRKPALKESLTHSRRSVELFFQALPESLEEEWTLESMAEVCDLGVTRFVYYCREITNQTPIEHLQELRLEAAAQTLCQAKPPPITEIALRLGFSSSQYFATVFRKRFGCSPSTYKRRAGDLTVCP